MIVPYSMVKKCIFLVALLPLPMHAALVEMWTFNDIAEGSINGDGSVASIGVNGGLAVIRGAGASSISTAGGGFVGTGGRGIDLPGGPSSTQAYIDLPNGIVSSRNQITINIWMSINGLQTWSRVFDFGSTDVGTGPQGGQLTGPGGGGSGFEYIMISAMNGTDPSLHRLEYRENNTVLAINDETTSFTLGTEHLWTFVWQDLGSGQARQSYYFDGVLEAQSASFTASLSNLNDVNNWLGRSNFTSDSNTDGTYDQIEIYDTAFSLAEVQASFAAGPIPEPSTHFMLAGALLALSFRRRRA